MRITGGADRGRRLRAPVGIRPTQDAVREALFSVLGEAVVGARFLDLYAGSGAVGLDAASRGAREVWWVEGSAAVASCLRRNQAATEAYGRVVATKVERFLASLKEAGDFDLVFADPPYAATEAEDRACLERLLTLLAGQGWVRTGGVFVYESAGRGDAEGGALPEGWVLTRDRRYGRARLRCFVRVREEASS